MVRGQNRHANSLATLALSMTKGVPLMIKMELIAELSINVAKAVSVVAMFDPCWINPIIDFLAEDRVPEDEKEAGKIRRVATRY